MSNWVSYKGKTLGKITIDENKKWIFAAESLEDLETLFRLNPDDIVEVEGQRDRTYKEFRSEHLEDISRFYPTVDDFLFRNFEARNLEEYREKYEPHLKEKHQ